MEIAGLKLLLSSECPTSRRRGGQRPVPTLSGAVSHRFQLCDVAGDDKLAKYFAGHGAELRLHPGDANKFRVLNFAEVANTNAVFTCLSCFPKATEVPRE